LVLPSGAFLQPTTCGIPREVDPGSHDLHKFPIGSGKSPDNRRLGLWEHQPDTVLLLEI
jgi:hypothetical protein